MKAVNNLEVRFGYLPWQEYGVVPEVIAYFDFGVTDNLTSRLDFDRIMAATGIGIGVSDLILTGTTIGMRNASPSTWAWAFIFKA